MESGYYCTAKSWVRYRYRYLGTVLLVMRDGSRQMETGGTRGACASEKTSEMMFPERPYLDHGGLLYNKQVRYLGRYR